MGFAGFYKLSIAERLEILKKERGITDEEAHVLQREGALTLDTADRMVENVVGTIHLPIGIATNFVINGVEYAIPMAIEEPSVIAGASKAAKLALPGGFTAKSDEPIMTGEIQLANITDGKKALTSFKKHKNEIETLASESAGPIKKYGGGFRGVEAKLVKTTRGEMLILYFSIDVRDAMGANTINTILETISPKVEEYIGQGTARLRILSNLAIKRKAYAEATLKKEVIGADAIEGMLDAYEFAQNDIYRCVTHNKGIMNGIDAVALATGQDWRAIEAGAHGYAAMKKYRSLTTYEKTRNGDLRAKIELPLAVGTVGGSINTSPTAKIALKILGVKTSKELAQAMACAGLANNIAALYALATTGIQAGHMRLHGKNIAAMAGAHGAAEIESVAGALAESKNFSLEYAKQVLEKIRKK